MNQSLLSTFGDAEQRVKAAIEAFKQGNGVLVLDDENRENEGESSLLKPSPQNKWPN